MFYFKNYINMKKLFIILFLGLITFGCKETLPIVDDFSKENFTLLDQDSNKVSYPASFKGEINVVGYIFTNCPDICPLTTNNMIQISDKLKEAGIKGVRFTAISFDPEYDTPFVLRQYMRVRDITDKNWTFLTGEKAEIERLMKRASVVSAVSDSSTLKSGKKIYFYVHTDRISLFDKDFKLRKNYPGSTINIDEIINDIKQLR